MIAGKLLAFRGENEVTDCDVLVEVMEVKGTNVEIAFDGPTKGVRTYLTVDLGQLVNQAQAFGRK